MESNVELSQEEIQKLSAEEVAKIAERLEKDAYTSAFESLNDWHILRTLAFMGSSLVEPYQHLLDLEAFDEC
jgi:ABC-type uncharacterized transport system auxiliary subunit